jgi:hypothetical protein
MAEDLIVKRLGGISDELNAIPQAIEKLIESGSEKKYYDENIGEVIKDGVLNVLLKVSEVEAGKNYYYNEVVDLVKNALTEVIEKVSKVRPDITPVFRIAADIAAGQKEILNAILNQPKPETNDFKYQELLAYMQKTNELLMLMISKKESPVIDITPKRELESIKFVHKIEYGRITETEGFPKYKI